MEKTMEKRVKAIERNIESLNSKYNYMNEFFQRWIVLNDDGIKNLSQWTSSIQTENNELFEEAVECKTLAQEVSNKITQQRIEIDEKLKKLEEFLSD